MAKAKRQTEQESPRPSWCRRCPFLGPVLVSIALLAMLPGAVFADCVHFPDHSYCERATENTTLVVLVAGLGYKDTWRDLEELIKSDPELSGIDYLLYHSPPELDLDGNVQRFAAILEGLAAKAKYRKRVYVGHSLGGMMVKILTLGLVTEHPAQLPNIVVTFGTPLDTDKFDIDLFRKLAAKASWANRKPLEKEVFNDGRVRAINLSWRTATKTGHLRRVRQVNVFGDGDWVAPATQEKTDSEISVLIRGNHSTIIPKRTDDCSFLIFKAVMRDENAVLAKLPCIVKDRPR